MLNAYIKCEKAGNYTKAYKRQLRISARTAGCWLREESSAKITIKETYKKHNTKTAAITKTAKEGIRTNMKTITATAVDS